MANARPLIIVGAGGFGREVAWLARSLAAYSDPVGFLDDADRLQGQSVCDLPVLGKIADWQQHAGARFIVAVGPPRARKAIVDRMTASGDVEFATLVHPAALHSHYVTFGAGSIVCAGSILTTQTAVGRHCILNLNVTVGHDVSMGDYCTLAPQAALSGNVTLARGVELGTAAAVVPGVTLGEGSMICAGAVVSKPLAANLLAAGSPARRVRDLEPFS